MRMMFLIAAAVAVFSAGAAPLNIAVYVDAGALNVGVFRWLAIASRAKDAVLTPVDADAIRAGATTGAEDEKNLTKVTFRLDFYRAFREGFLSELGSCMTEKEVETLALGALAMTVECGIRFLSDYFSLIFYILPIINILFIQG